MKIFKRNIEIKKLIVGLISLLSLSGCAKYLDVVPDNVATIDNAFAMRSEAEKFLYTCYSYMPKDGNPSNDPAFIGGDEMWALIDPPFPEFDHRFLQLARGFQTANNPYGDWYWSELYRALRDCNIFLENIGRVPDITDFERSEWIAEVKVLKAYYHFYLLRMYGPIPLIKVNLPIDVDTESAKVYRDPVDSCFAYMATLLDEAKDQLPLTIENPARMLGRLTRPIAYALKAKILVTAASPLFNGNIDQAKLIDNRGVQLFNQEVSPQKWTLAATACKEAIDICHDAGNKLYTFNPSFQQYELTDTMQTQMSIRNVVTERWNEEVIWANTQSVINLLQRVSAAKVDHRYLDNPRVVGELAPPLKMAELFYSDNGVPIAEDITRVQGNLSLRQAALEDRLYIREGYTTAALHFDREPRFYANLGFDGGVWYGQGRYNDAAATDLFYVATKNGQPNRKSADGGSETGYYIKKLVHFQNTQGASVDDYTVTTYPWTIIRLADLYLLYAEALNEAGGSEADVLFYLDEVRERAGLKGVVESWTNFSRSPEKFVSQVGRREIIQRERLIELAFEGQRFWDLRRWKTAMVEQSKPLTGWDNQQTANEFYYRTKVIFNQRFGLKDYFWPLHDNTVLVNDNLIQNLGW